MNSSTKNYINVTLKYMIKNNIKSKRNLQRDYIITKYGNVTTFFFKFFKFFILEPPFYLLKRINIHLWSLFVAPPLTEINQIYVITLRDPFIYFRNIRV